MAHALIVTRHGGREVLDVQSRPRPRANPGEAVIEVAAAGVNFIDVYQREGIYPIPTPFILGTEGAGTVVEVGSPTDAVAVGDVVAWAMQPGSAATHAVIPTSALVPVPTGLDPEVAAAAMLQGMTAHFLTTSTHPVDAGTVALVHAAAGGVGQLLVQMLKARGATVIATAGSAEKLRTARARGADHAIDYSRAGDLAAAVRSLTPDGLGVHVVYDGVGRATFDASLDSLRPRGTLVVFGAASGAVPPFDVQRLNAGGSLFITRPSLAHHLGPELPWRAGEVLGAAANGSLTISIGGRYPLAEAAAAYAALEGRATQGKLLLIP